MLNRWKIVAAVAVLCWLPVARGDAIPDLPAGTAVQVREGDVWSSATFLRKEGHRAQIRYSDGSEEWVGPDRFRLPAGTVAPPANDSDTPHSDAKDSTGTSVTTGSDEGVRSDAATPLEKQDISIDYDNPPQSQEKIDAASLSKTETPSKAEFIHFGNQTRGFQGFPKPFLQCADTPTIIFSLRDQMNMGRQNTPTTLGRIDITAHDGVGYRTIPVKAEEVRGVGSGGRYLATVTTVDRVPTLKQWVYENGNYQVRASVKMVSSTGQFEYGKVWPIGGDRMIVERAREGLYLINLPKARVEAFCKHGWDEPQLTADGRALLVRQDGKLLLVRTSDLSIAASIPNGNGFGRFTVDPSCTYVAYNAQDRVHIVKIASGEEIGKVIAGPGSGDFYLLSGDDVAFDHNSSLDIYDVKSGYPIWSYKHDHISNFVLAADGQFLLHFDDGTFALATLPGPKAMASLKSLSPDKYALFPGTAIAVKGDAGIFSSTDKDVKAAVKNSLELAGHTLTDDSSPYVVSWTSAAGPTETKKFYHTVMPGSPITTGAPIDVSIPSTVVTVTLTFQGQTIWTNNMTFKAPPYMRLNQGQNPQDVANAAAKPDVGRLRNLGIPAFLLKGATTGAPVSAMVSEITPGGIIDDKK